MQKNAHLPFLHVRFQTDVFGAGDGEAGAAVGHTVRVDDRLVLVRHLHVRQALGAVLARMRGNGGGVVVARAIRHDTVMTRLPVLRLPALLRGHGRFAGRGGRAADERLQADVEAERTLIAAAVEEVDFRLPVAPGVRLPAIFQVERFASR